MPYFVVKAFAARRIFSPKLRFGEWSGPIVSDMLAIDPLRQLHRFTAEQDVTASSSLFYGGCWQWLDWNKNLVACNATRH